MLKLRSLVNNHCRRGYSRMLDPAGFSKMKTESMHAIISISSALLPGSFQGCQMVSN